MTSNKKSVLSQLLATKIFKVYDKMGSLSPNFTGRNGVAIPLTAIEELKTSLTGNVVVKGEAAEDVYHQAIHRWNESFIEEAVRSSTLYRCII